MSLTFPLLDPSGLWLHERPRPDLFQFSIWVCTNGWEWMTREMGPSGLYYVRPDNCFLWSEDFAWAPQLMIAHLRTGGRKHWVASPSNGILFMKSFSQVPLSCLLVGRTTVSERYCVSKPRGAPAPLSATDPSWYDELRQPAST